MWKVRKFGSLLYSSDSHARCTCRHQVQSVMARKILFHSDCEIYVQKYSLWRSLTAYLCRILVFSPMAVDVEFQRIEVTPAEIRLSPAGRNHKLTNVLYSFIDIMGQYDRPL